MEDIYKEQLEQYLPVCLEGVLMKWGGSDSPGHKIEEELADYSEYTVFDAILNFNPNSKVEVAKLISQFALQELYDKILYFTKETGVDGLLIKSDHCSSFSVQNRRV